MGWLGFELVESTFGWDLRDPKDSKKVAASHGTRLFQTSLHSTVHLLNHPMQYHYSSQDAAFGDYARPAGGPPRRSIGLATYKKWLLPVILQLIAINSVTSDILPVILRQYT